MTSAVARRRQSASFGKTPTTRVRRRISWFSRSGVFTVRRRVRCAADDSAVGSGVSVGEICCVGREEEVVVVAAPTVDEPGSHADNAMVPMRRLNFSSSKTRSAERRSSATGGAGEPLNHEKPPVAPVCCNGWFGGVPHPARCALQSR